jgi:Protein of unknown function (DUF2680).
MKQKYAAILLVFSLFICFGSISAAAASEQDEQSQCEEMKERYKEITDRFNSLTDAQKDQIYKLNAKVIKQAETLMQKYVDLGVLSKEEADHIISRVTNKNAKAQKEGKLVGIPGPCRKCCPNKAE